LHPAKFFSVSSFFSSGHFHRAPSSCSFHHDKLAAGIDYLERIGTPSRVPYLSKLPFPAIAIIVTLIVVNLLTWAAVGIVLVLFE
jgi:hypothetical protein